jgi:YD repeat-containing protein
VQRRPPHHGERLDKRRLRSRTKYDYDGLQRLAAAEWKDSCGASLYAYTYDYDRVGNRTHLAHNGQHTDTTYNPANELAHEHTPGADQVYYAYDGRGNQTRRTVLGGETTYYDYNSRNLITRIDSTEPGFVPNTFAYNALGQRVRIADSAGANGRGTFREAFPRGPLGTSKEDKTA